MMQSERSHPQAVHPVRAFLDVQTAGDTIIIPGVPGTSIRIYKFVLTVGGAVVITLKEGQRENSGGLRVANNGNVVLMFESDVPLECPAGQPLVLNLTVAVRLTGFVEYMQGP
jgi:hypothetical protein